MKLFTRGSRAIEKGWGGRGTPLRIGALGALIITLVLVGCPTVETITETIISATNLQRRIVPAGILLSWNAPTAGEVGGFNVYNGVDAGALNGAPLNARRPLLCGYRPHRRFRLCLRAGDHFQSERREEHSSAYPSRPDNVSASRQCGQSVDGG